MPQCVVVCKQECNLSADIIVSPCAGTRVRVPINSAPQRCMTHEFPMFFYACGIENPTGFPLCDGGLPVGFLRFERNAHKAFSICGYSFQNELGFQRDGNSFGSGFPIGARASCWLGNPKGTAFPWQWFPKAAALPWRVEFNGGPGPSWQEESNETGGFVAHDFARKV